MRILNWMQKKFNGKPDNKRSFDPVSISAPSYDRKEEFSDWPQALLAIGTFGNKEISEKQETTQHDDESSEDELHEDETSQDLQDFTLEEVTKLQNELTKLLKHKPKPKPDAPEITGEDRANLPLNRFLNCPSSLEVERIANINEAKIILNKAKDALMDNGSKIRRRSISFLLKKMFVCKSGLPPMPNIRDSVPESKIDKLLRMILHKKIYPPSSTPTLLKKYLDKKQDEKRIKDEEDEGCKWVKTDSEFIVLEM
ncbi:protein NEGATIVE GRAVITROPIC RESPONSE OF ROOTS-like [Dioscorea cayenensis subsp. rotundata]|uniref:Protein NEGATIVE GRAVITROPIC RESPONSE OF ROOTS-like n=1 Tax=Dioscorea cayennensis subsp. rotundata TaxID=55577 RepID=A0AB40D084_DIOCR|nr:protein NEGATIVE GRAVITROPIC RESPONSE OF ROOTS-like [Dioscorea cayenensis subsp. rotundata]